MNLDRKSGVGFVLAVGVWAGLISGVVAVSQGVPEPVKVITGAGNNEVKPANVLPPDESEKETLKKYQASEWAGRFFRKALAPYGEWMDVQKLGQVWRPKVEKGWSPYSVGDWVYTDLGWVWTGDEPFASIVVAIAAIG
jgi:hypothetical protein